MYRQPAVRKIRLSNGICPRCDVNYLWNDEANFSRVSPLDVCKACQDDEIQRSRMEIPLQTPGMWPVELLK